MKAVHIVDANTLRLKAIVAEVGVDALIRVLRVFQDRNVNPRKVSAQRVLLRSQGREALHLEVEFAIADLTLDALRFIAANIAQMPTTVSTVFGEATEGHSAKTP